MFLTVMSNQKFWSSSDILSTDTHSTDDTQKKDIQAYMV